MGKMKNLFIELINKYGEENIDYVLIGEPGVGKTAIVEGLSQLISSNDCPSFLRDKRIIELDMATIMSGTSSQGDLEINKMKSKKML